ncbi:TIGR03086 family metal-binding protein [Fodinicola acaciae]|uniref:TIGR03086 family metal-binding protein n=1 Tax=Fodinicola acaciae TaxID=2681555 RepID=UPI0013D1AD99|nr:TIGR03086 family metal-binding protein [Fodinicola acaciae]
MNEPRPLFGKALDQAGRVIAAAGDASMGLPTPCDDFDVRALCGHLVSVVRRIEHVGGGGRPFDIPQITTDVPDGFPAAFAKARAEMEATWSDDAVLDKVLVLPFGEFPGRIALSAYTQEIVMHSWDLAKALGRLDLLDDELAETVLPIARRAVPAEPRGGRIPFGPVVEVPADAGAYAQLAGYLGRQP